MATLVWTSPGVPMSHSRGEGPGTPESPGRSQPHSGPRAGVFSHSHERRGLQPALPLPPPLDKHGTPGESVTTSCLSPKLQTRSEELIVTTGVQCSGTVDATTGTQPGVHAGTWSCHRSYWAAMVCVWKEPVGRRGGPRTVLGRETS